MKKLTTIVVLGIVLVALIVIFVAFAVAIGVTYPHPNSFQLYVGETGNFNFQLQTDDSDVNFTFYIDEDSPLELTLPEDIIVPANQRYNVAGSVYVPEGLASGNYTEKFCARGCPVEGNVCMAVCGLPINVEVISVIFDEDNDGIPDSEDKCPETIEEQIVYGCSCNQILDLKPGEDTGQLRNGCSEGTLLVFERAIGWAKDLFE